MNQDLKKMILKNKPLVLAGAAAVLIVITTIVVVQRNSESPPADTVKVTAPLSADVQITDSGFIPATLSIKAGTKVVWTNTSPTLHQIASNPHPTHSDLPSLDSAILNEQQSYEYSFNDPGTYRYHDEQNPVVNGTVEVRE